MKTLKISGLFLGLMAFSSVSAVSREPASELDSLTVSGSLIQTSEFSNTGAVATVSGEELAESPTPNLTNRLAGRLPGLFVLKGDGTPGEGTAKMYIRGIGSYAKGTETNTMKYYVDGFEVKSDYIEFLNPEEIYGGCYGRVSINFFPFKHDLGNAGVAAGLNNVQKLEDGERLGGNRATAEQDFDDGFTDDYDELGI